MLFDQCSLNVLTESISSFVMSLGSKKSLLFMCSKTNGLQKLSFTSIPDFLDMKNLTHQRFISRLRLTVLHLSFSSKGISGFGSIPFTVYSFLFPSFSITTLWPHCLSINSYASGVLQGIKSTLEIGGS